jgi:hypothetical protein
MKKRTVIKILISVWLLIFLKNIIKTLLILIQSGDPSLLKNDGALWIFIAPIIIYSVVKGYTSGIIVASTGLVLHAAATAWNFVQLVQSGRAPRGIFVMVIPAVVAAHLFVAYYLFGPYRKGNKPPNQAL